MTNCSFYVHQRMNYARKLLHLLKLIVDEAPNKMHPEKWLNHILKSCWYYIDTVTGRVTPSKNKNKNKNQATLK